LWLSNFQPSPDGLTVVARMNGGGDNDGVKGISWRRLWEWCVEQMLNKRHHQCID
jgi:hypothetical protein